MHDLLRKLRKVGYSTPILTTISVVAAVAIVAVIWIAADFVGKNLEVAVTYQEQEHAHCYVTRIMFMADISCVPKIPEYGEFPEAHLHSPGMELLPGWEERADRATPVFAELCRPDDCRFGAGNPLCDYRDCL